MGSGRDKQAEAQSRQITSQQLQQQQQLYDWSQQRTAKMDELQNPAIKYAQGMTSGDPEKIAFAGAIPVANITKSFNATKQNIYDSVPSGAARDFALASAERGKNADIGSTLNQGFFESLNTLMQAGGAQGNFGLQQLGAGMRAGETAQQGTQLLMNQAQQRKATQMGFLGSLAGAAGTAAGGFMMRPATSSPSSPWSAMGTMN